MSDLKDLVRDVLARMSPTSTKEPEPEKPAVLDVAPPTTKQNRARLAAYGREGSSVEELTLEEDAQYQDTIARRRDMKHSLDTMPAGISGWENDFYREEQTRRDAACNLIRRGFPILQIAIATGLEPDEVRALKGTR